MTDEELQVRSEGLAVTIDMMVNSLLIEADGDTFEEGTALAERAFVKVLAARLSGGLFPVAARLREWSDNLQRRAMATGAEQ